jgi:hypothetical protein
MEEWAGAVRYTVPTTTRSPRAAGLFVVWLFVLLASSGCDDSGPKIIDQTWSARYYVSNETPWSLLVRPVSDRFESDRMIQVEAGETAEVGRYAEFLGGPPNPSRDFICFSVFRASDHRLVYQTTWPSNAGWIREDISDYRSEVTLTLVDDDLHHLGVPNSCGTLVGTVRDSLSGKPLYHVRVEVSPHESSWERCARTNERGEYRLTWPDTIPDGKLWVLQQGYRELMLDSLPPLEDLGDRHYRLDLELAPGYQVSR